MSGVTLGHNAADAVAFHDKSHRGSCRGELTGSVVLGMPEWDKQQRRKPPVNT